MRRTALRCTAATECRGRACGAGQLASGGHAQYVHAARASAAGVGAVRNTAYGGNRGTYYPLSGTPGLDKHLFLSPETFLSLGDHKSFEIFDQVSTQRGFQSYRNFIQVSISS